MTANRRNPSAATRTPISSASSRAASRRSAASVSGPAPTGGSTAPPGSVQRPGAAVVADPRPTTSPRSVGSSTVTNTEPGTSAAARRTRSARYR
ncbi:hypothetical protein EAO70_16520 [Streptomyces sp. adm13(2018)]|nr:hypothetical protein EAO70_16520 [Streptomyces sp. adm13(2018)]